MISLVEVLTRTETWFRQRGIDSPRLNAELLLCKVLGMSRVSLYLAFDRPMTDEELAALRPLVARRGQREPLSWITGETSFHELDLSMHPGVLDPRPDTEALVNAALSWIPAEVDPVYVADIGCGSGCIGLAIAHARPGARVYATDISPEALSLAKQNVVRTGLQDRVAVLRGDLLSPIPDKRPVDWVLSNPPYIPSADIDSLQPEVSQHEPRLALDGGADGLEVYRRLIPIARQRARQGLLVEIGYDQAARVMDLFRRAGFVDISSWKDLGGHIRVVGGRCPSS